MTAYGLSRDSPWSHVAWRQALDLDIAAAFRLERRSRARSRGRTELPRPQRRRRGDRPSSSTERASSARHGCSSRPRCPTSTCCSPQPAPSRRRPVRGRGGRRDLAGCPHVRERVHRRRRRRRRRAGRGRPPSGRLPLLALRAPAGAGRGALDGPVQLPAARRAPDGPRAVAVRARLLAARGPLRPGGRVEPAPTRHGLRGRAPHVPGGCAL